MTEITGGGQAIEVRATAAQLTVWKRPSEVKARLAAIQGLMKEVLEPDVDYGVIPGMPKEGKPGLFKPGSEKILAMFELAVEPMVEEISTDDCFRFRVFTRITHAPTGVFLGSGIGECSSNETKYKWRRTYSQKEFDATPEDRRRIKHGRYKKEGKWLEFQEMQVRQEPADMANTVLKMAKKRSQIDGTLTTTGASSMFEQGEDLKDMSEEARSAVTGHETFADGSPVDDTPIAATTKKPAATKAATATQPQAQPVAATPADKPAAQPAAAQPAAAPAEPKPAAANGTTLISDPQRRRLYAICKSAEKTVDEAKSHLKKTYGIDSTANIPASAGYTYGVYEAMCDWADPKFKFHTDDFPGNHVLGAKKGAAPAATEEDENW